MTMPAPAIDPARRRQLVTAGLWIFLAALAMLFASSMLGYVLVRVRSSARLELPHLLFLSTGLIVASSVTLHLALAAVQRERQSRLRTMLAATLALALAFVFVQAPALVSILADHQAIRATGLHAYGLVFFLVLLHALHVVGGIVALVRVNLGAIRGQYDHESQDPIRHAAMYWHFLDGVWLVMFAIFLILR